MSFGFGIIGCGMISRFHAKAIADLDNANLIGCWNRTPDAAAKLASETESTAFKSLDEMLANPEIDVVTIGTASGAHRDPAVAAANAGKHVIIEKPLEVTLERCDQIIEACEKNGVKLATIFPSRFHRSSQILKKAVDADKFGNLTIGDAYVKWYRSQEYYDSGAWRGTWKWDGGGALMNQAIHSVDLLYWLMGPVQSVVAQTATLAHDRIEVEDVATAALKFKNGALGVIEATTSAFPGSLKKIELHGSKGSATLEEENITVWEFAEPNQEDRDLLERMSNQTETGGGAADPAAIGHHGHCELFRDTLQAIENDTTPLIDGHEGRRSVEIVLAVYQAAKSGTRVNLPL